MDYSILIIARDATLRALSSLRGLRGAPEVPPLCRETQSLGQHMLELSCENATVGKNGLRLIVMPWMREKGALKKICVFPEGFTVQSNVFSLLNFRK